MFGQQILAEQDRLAFHAYHIVKRVGSPEQLDCEIVCALPPLDTVIVAHLEQVVCDRTQVRQNLDGNAGEIGPRVYNGPRPQIFLGEEGIAYDDRDFRIGGYA